MSTAPFPLIYVNNYDQRAFYYMRGQDRDKSVFNAVYQATAVVCQTVEDAVFDLVTGMQFQYATDEALNRWGSVVGQNRLGMVDLDYRRLIGAKIRVNNSFGTIDETARILLIASEGRAWIASNVPMIYAASYLVSSISGNLRRAILRNMADTKPLGIKLMLIEGSSDSLVLADEPTGTAMDSYVAGLTPTPSGFETRLDYGTLAMDVN